MIIWITGRPNTGKTTTAKRLCENDGTVLLDGDELRSIFGIKGFSKKDRIEL